MSAFDGWAVVEILGHRVRYGRVSEVTLFGEAFCKVEMPSDPPAVEFYSGKALYGIRPASEDAVRAYHEPRRALTSGEVVVADDGWGDDDMPSDPRCGGCGEPLLGIDRTVRVADDDGEREVWHELCAKERAERASEAIDGEQPL